MKKEIQIAGFSKEQREKELERIKIKSEKKGYKFLEYKDNGALKSIAIFEVDDITSKKEKSKKLIIYGAIFLILAFFMYPKDNSKIITPNDVTKEWPLKTDIATLKCYKDGDIISPVVEVNNVSYGLTGFADNKYGQQDLKAFNKIWRENPDYKNTYISISEITEIAKSLCN